MALELGYNFKGIEAKYWTIVSENGNQLKEEYFPIIGLFLNKEVYDKAKKEGKRQEVMLTTVQIDKPIKGKYLTPAQLYAGIKSFDGWINSKDC